MIKPNEKLMAAIKKGQDEREAKKQAELEAERKQKREEDERYEQYKQKLLAHFNTGGSDRLFELIAERVANGDSSLHLNNEAALKILGTAYYDGWRACHIIEGILGSIAGIKVETKAHDYRPCDECWERTSWDIYVSW